MKRSILIAVALMGTVACSLLTSLDDLRGGGSDANAPNDATSNDASSNSDAPATGHWLYVIGGGTGNWGLGAPADASPTSTSVFAAPIHDDGTLGAWTTKPDLPQPYVHDNPAVLTYGRYAIVVGDFGTPNGTPPPSGTVIFADLAGAATWQTTTPVSKARGGWENQYGAATDGKIVITAGGDDTVQQTNALSVGGVSAWTSAPSLPYAVGAATMTVVGETAYVFGNPTVDGGSSLRLLYAPIGDAGVGTWIDPNITAPNRAYFNVGVLGTHIYVVSGNNTMDVEMVTVGQNGVPGPFVQSAPLTATRSNACVIGGPNAIYVIGGSTGIGVSTELDTIFYAVPASDGSIGSWQTTTPLPAPRSGAACIVM